MCVICSAKFHFYIPACRSLKQKRSIIKPIVLRLHREFNVSVSEIEKLDVWNEAIIICAHTSNDRDFSYSYMQRIQSFIETNFRNTDLLDTKVEII